MLSIHKGDILTSTAEAVVNPANSFLNHSGGLAAIIDRAAQAVGWSAQTGQQYRSHREKRDAWLRDNDNAPLLATGNAHITSAGNLPFKHVIHAVGPIWNDGGFHEPDLLEMAMESVCEKAFAASVKSIAVPAISCGIFGFPLDAAARILVNVAQWSADELDVEFWLFGQDEYDAFHKQLHDPLFG